MCADPRHDEEDGHNHKVMIAKEEEDAVLPLPMQFSCTAKQQAKIPAAVAQETSRKPIVEPKPTNRRKRCAASVPVSWFNRDVPGNCAPTPRAQNAEKQPKYDRLPLQRTAAPDTKCCRRLLKHVVDANQAERTQCGMHRSAATPPILRAAIFQARVVTAPTYRGGKPRGPSHAWDDAVLAKTF